VNFQVYLCQLVTDLLRGNWRNGFGLDCARLLQAAPLKLCTCTMALYNVLLLLLLLLLLRAVTAAVDVCAYKTVVGLLSYAVARRLSVLSYFTAT